jgi:hypothetical protein
MSNAALVSTVTRRSTRRLYIDLTASLVANANTVGEPTLTTFIPIVLTAAHTANASSVHDVALSFVSYDTLTVAHITNGNAIHAPAIDNFDGLLELSPPHFVNINAFRVHAISLPSDAEATTEYTNYLGSGDRRFADMQITCNDTATAAEVLVLYDGVSPNNQFYLNGGTAARNFVLQFLNPVVITEARWKQGNSDTHGVWKWQGSNDGATYTDIGTSSTLGGAEVTTHTQLAANTTYYLFYRLLRVSGSVSSGPFIDEIELKIYAEPSSTSFDNGAAFSKGNRSSTITVAQTGFSSIFGSSTSVFVDGSLADDWYCSGGAGTCNLRFDFGTAQVIKAAHIIRSGGEASGNWVLQGSDNGTTFTTISGTAVAMNRKVTTLWARANVTAYRYYRISKSSGTASGSPYWEEIYFAHDSGVIPGGGGGPPDPEAELYPAMITNAPTIHAPGLVQANVLGAPHLENANAINTTTLEQLTIGDDLWEFVALLIDSADHSASAESSRLRHHSADSNVGMFIPLSNASYSAAQKLPGRDYSITGGISNALAGIYELDLNGGAFTIEARVRRSTTVQSLLINQGVGSNVMRFGFEAGNNARLMFSYTSNGVTWNNIFSLAAAVSASHAWKHIAANWGLDDVLRLFVDGVMVAKTTIPYFFPTPIEAKLNVGASLASGGLLFYDDLRITIGADRYGSDASFTPPEALERGPSPDPYWSDVTVLQRFDAVPGSSAPTAYLADASKAGAHMEAAGGCNLIDGDPTAVASTGGGFIRTKAGAVGTNLAAVAEWTIEARANLANTADVSGAMCAQESVWTGSPGSIDKQWRFGFTSDAKPTFTGELVGGSTFSLTGPNALSKLTWYDLAVDKIEATVRLYVDGVMVASGVMSADIANHAPSTKCFFMFGGSGSGGSGFPGALDEVRVTKNRARYADDDGYTPIAGKFPAY